MSTLTDVLKDNPRTVLDVPATPKEENDSPKTPKSPLTSGLTSGLTSPLSPRAHERGQSEVSASSLSSNPTVLLPLALHVRSPSPQSSSSETLSFPRTPTTTSFHSPSSSPPPSSPTRCPPASASRSVKPSASWWTVAASRAAAPRSAICWTATTTTSRWQWTWRRAARRCT